MSGAPQGGPLYKILPAAAWQAADGRVPWAEVDRADGFVHLSAAHQVAQTARKHFAGQADLCVLEIDPARLPPGTLRWEVSRGGDLFPHVYGEIEADAIVGVDALPLRDDAPTLPVHVPVPLPLQPMPDVLARRLEVAEVGLMLALGRCAARVTPQHDPATRQLGSGVAARFGVHAPINAFKGWGLDASVCATDLDTAEQLFDSVGASFAVEVSSHAHPQALALLGARGYQAVSTENCMFRRLEGLTPPDDRVTLQRATPDEATDWGALMTRGFSDGVPPTPELSMLGTLTLDLGQTTAYFIVAQGERVGACSLRLDHDLAMLVGSAVTVQHRGRGYQRAAIAHRLALAKHAGCRYAKFDVAPGSTSHRNAHRAGFAVSHTRTVFVRKSVATA